MDYIYTSFIFSFICSNFDTSESAQCHKIIRRFCHGKMVGAGKQRFTHTILQSTIPRTRAEDERQTDQVDDGQFRDTESRAIL